MIPVGREAIVELLQLVLQAAQYTALLAELLFERLYLGIHRRQLFQRVDLIPIAQPPSPLGTPGRASLGLPK